VIEEIPVGVRPEQRSDPADHDAAGPPGPERAAESTVKARPSEMVAPRHVADRARAENRVRTPDVADAREVAAASVQAAEVGRRRPRGGEAMADCSAIRPRSRAGEAMADCSAIVDPRGGDTRTGPRAASGDATAERARSQPAADMRAAKGTHAHAAADVRTAE